MYKKYSGSNTLRITGIAVVVLIIATLLSCEKEVKIDLESGDPTVVVEGAIETGVPPYVILTKSIGYFSKIDLETIQNSFVHGAEVTVSDGIKTVNLVEYSIDTGLNGNKFSIYTIDTTQSPSAWFVGEVNKTYKLTISYEGKIYEASTKIPAPTTLDSVITAPPPFISEGNKEAKLIKIFFKDPDSLGNYIRYYTKRNSEPFYPGLNSVYSDELINGTNFETSLAAGEDRSKEQNFDSSGYFYVGDTVILKWCAIDKGSYEFWNTYEFALGTLGSPFASPTRVKTNISNKALGIWAGYGTAYYRHIIK
jgi:hypothetical protein